VKRNSIRISGIFIAAWLMLGIRVPVTRAQGSLKTIDAPQGGKIVYGAVGTASTQAEALAEVLRGAHKSYGEKPRTGQVFRLRYTNSAAVFFIVANRSRENKLFAGLAIAAATDSGKVETALVTDEAARFGKTVNPMLKRLSEVWQPAGLELAPGARESAMAMPIYRSSPSDTPAAKTGSTAYDRFIWDLEFSTQNDARENRPLALHTIAAADGTASAGIPDGWKLDPKSGDEALAIHGPNGEVAVLNLMHLAADSTVPKQSVEREHSVPNTRSGEIAFSSAVDLAEAFPDLLQQWRKSNGLDPAELEIDYAQRMPASPTERCVYVVGRVNPDGKGMQEMNTVMCTTMSFHGDSLVLVFQTLVPSAVADRERSTMGAILASYRLNRGFTDSRAHDPLAPGIGFAFLTGLKVSGQYDDYQARAEEPDVHPAGYMAKWWVDRKNEREHGSYLLDEYLLQNNGKNGEGAAWKSAADAQIKAHPGRFELVTALQEIQGAKK
jgi:hypothetical protein